jgi:dTMP kinase
MSRGLGLLIAFEGIDGVGKSSQIEMLKTRNSLEDLNIVYTRQPGGGAIGDKFRDLIFSKELQHFVCKEIKYSLYMANIAYENNCIIHNLLKKVNVISDRHIYSTLAYQVGKGYVTLEKFKSDVDFFGIVIPHITVYFKVIDSDIPYFIKRKTHKDILDDQPLEHFENLSKCYDTLFEHLKSKDNFKYFKSEVIVIDILPDLSKEDIHKVLVEKLKFTINKFQTYIENMQTE